MKRKLFLTAAVIAFCLNAKAQQFQAYYPNAVYSGIYPLSAGGYMLVGQPGITTPSILLQSIDTNGDVTSSHNIASAGSGLNTFSEGANHPVLQDGDNFLITLYSSGFEGNSSIYPGLMKTDAAGQVLWNKVYHNENNTTSTNARGGFSATIKDGDNYVSAGWFNSITTGGMLDYFNAIQKSDSDGNVLWRYNFSPAFLFLSDIVISNDGNYMALGGVSGGTYLFSFTQDGVFNYYKHYLPGGATTSTAGTLLPLDEGGYVIAGSVMHNDDYNGLLVKLDNQGEIAWVKKYGGILTDKFRKAIKTTDGGFLICGTTQNSGGFEQGWLLKTDSNGEVEWSRKFGETAGAFYALLETANGYVAVGGTGTNGWVVNTDFTGNADTCLEEDLEITVTDLTATTTTTTTNTLTTHTSTGFISQPATTEVYDTEAILADALPSIAAAANYTICTGSTTQLTATTDGETVNWYSEENATNAIATGLSFETPSLNETTTYWAEAQNGSCPSERIVVTVTVNPIPAAPTGEAAQDFTSGESLSDIEITAEGTITWYADENMTEVLPETTLPADNTTYYVTQTVNGCESTPFAVTVHLVLGVGLHDKTMVTYYPNPVNDVLHIETVNPISDFMLYDNNGRTLMQSQPATAKTDIDVKSLPAGIYFCAVKTGDKTSVFKLVKI